MPRIACLLSDSAGLWVRWRCQADKAGQAGKIFCSSVTLALTSSHTSVIVHTSTVSGCKEHVCQTATIAQAQILCNGSTQTSEGRSRRLSPEEVQALCGERDHAELVIWQHHLSRVPPMVEQYQGGGLPEETLIQGSNAVLWQGVKTFLPEKAYPQDKRFSDYASTCITEACQKAINGAQGSGEEFKSARKDLHEDAAAFLQTLGCTASAITSLYQYKAALQRIESLSLAQERELFETRNRAVNDLWANNLRLVWSIAKRYGGSGVPDGDVIQAGSLGLRQAVMKFDPKRGRLSTYADDWINSAMLQAINDDQGSGRGFTQSVIKDIFKYDKLCQSFLRAYAREPNDEEIAQHYGRDWTPTKVARIKEASIAYRRRPVSWDPYPLLVDASGDMGLSPSEQFAATEDALSDDARESLTASAGDVTYATSEREALKRQLQRIFARLSLEHREVLLWWFAREMKRKDIAEKRGTQGPAVSRLLHERAIPALEAELKAEGMGKEDVRKVLGYFFDDEVIKQQMQEAYKCLSADNQRYLLQQLHHIRPVATTQAGRLAIEVFAAACKAADLPRDNVTSDAAELCHAREVLRTAMQGAGMPEATVQEVLDIFAH